MKKTCRILIVEDENIVALDIEEHLTAMGFESVGYTGNGRQALFMAMQHRPDLVLMDIRLKGEMDGIDTAKEIRKRYRLPVIFLTAYAEDATLERAREAEPFGYILKPFDDLKMKASIEIAVFKHQTEEELRRVNRLYSALSNVNRSLGNAESRESLLADVCRHLVECGGVDSAWMGWRESPSEPVRPAACFGIESDRAEIDALLAGEKPSVQGSPVRVMDQNVPFITNDGLQEEPLHPFRDWMNHQGFQSAALFPIRFSGSTCGVLCVFVRKGGFFRQKEMSLLEEVTLNISNALEKMDSECKRRQAEAALRNSEEQLRLFFAHAPASLAMFDREMRYLHTSRRWLSTFQREGKNVIGLSHYEDFPEIPDRWKEAHRRALAGEVVRAEEDRFERADGSVHWVRWEVHPWLDHGGQIGGIVIFTEDISAKKKAQQKIEEAEERFRQVADNADEWIWEIDADGLYTYSSSAVARILGYTPDEIVGKRRYYDFIDSEAQQSRLEMIFDAMRESKSYSNFKSERIRIDGKKVVLESAAFPITDRKGALLGYRGTHRNITEQIEAAETKNLLAAVVEHSSEILVVCDRQGNITYVNPAFERVTGYAAGETIGRNPRLLKSGRHDAAFYADMWKTIASGGIWRGRLINKKKNGELFEEETTISSIKDPDGNIVNYVAMKRDVTREAALQRQLIQSQKMEAIGTLAGGIAHDFNNILSAINGYTELAMDELPEGSRALSDLEQVLNAGRRAGEMVRQILTFSRQNLPERHLIHLSPLVKEGLKFLRAAIPSSIEIREKVDATVGKILGNPTQIHQVLMNLCTNAWHAMKDTTGILTAELAEIELTDDFTRHHPPLKPGKHVRLRVGDTGTGIAKEMTDRIFDPYFTTKSVGEGTGMGLSVLLGIVQTHDGAVTVDSELGKGTVFDLYFPVAQKVETSPAASGTDVPPGGSECILLVDDEDALCRLMQRILRHLGYETVATTDAVEALECFCSDPQRFDLVITDLTMPKMTGVSLAGELKAIRPQVPVILCTGAEQAVSDEVLAQAGIAAAVKKPISKGILADTVRRILDQDIQEQR